MLRAPTLEYGVNVESERGFAGNGSVRKKTLHRMLNDLLSSWELTGVREFILVTPHGHDPHQEALATVITTEARVRVVDIFAVPLGDIEVTECEMVNQFVGGQGIGFNLARGLYYNAYGYPAAPPFNGETLKSCSGTATNDVWGGTQSQSIPCNMTGGSSGGPWLTGSTINSVNSFGYSGVPNRMFGPQAFT